MLIVSYLAAGLIYMSLIILAISRKVKGDWRERVNWAHVWVTYMFWPVHIGILIYSYLEYRLSDRSRKHQEGA